jgi:hypothetical protein
MLTWYGSCAWTKKKVDTLANMSGPRKKSLLCHVHISQPSTAIGHIGLTLTVRNISLKVLPTFKETSLLDSSNIFLLFGKLGVVIVFLAAPLGGSLILYL